MNVSTSSCDTTYCHRIFLSTASRRKPTKMNQSQNYLKLTRATPNELDAFFMSKFVFRHFLSFFRHFSVIFPSIFRQYFVNVSSIFRRFFVFCLFFVVFCLFPTTTTRRNHKNFTCICPNKKTLKFIA